MDGIMLTFDENGVATEYDDTYDIVIHCENKEQNETACKQIANIIYILYGGSSEDFQRFDEDLLKAFFKVYDDLENNYLDAVI